MSYLFKRKKELVVIILLISVVLLLSVVAFHSLKTSRGKTSLPAAGSVFKPKIEKDSFVKKKLDRFITQAKNARTSRHEDVDEDGDDESITEEERRIFLLANHYNKVLGYKIVELAQLTLEKMLQEEIKDDKWKKEVENYSEKMLQEEEYKDTQREEVLCGETICKMSFSHLDEEVRKSFQRSFFSIGPWGEGHQVGVDVEFNSGSPGTVVYFSKERDFLPFLIMRERIAKENGERIIPR